MKMKLIAAQLYPGNPIASVPKTVLDAQTNGTLMPAFVKALLNRGDWAKEAHLAASPYPFWIPREKFQELAKFNSLLTEALQRIVRKWFSTPEFQSFIPLEPRILNILSALQDREYQIGSIRPDFLFDKEGNVKLAEVNARFQFNGYMMSFYGQEALKELQGGSFYDLNVCSSIDPRGVIEAGFKQLYNEEKPLVLCREKESGYDIHMFKNVWIGPMREAAPGDLRVVGGVLHDKTGPVEQVALECQQPELESMSDEVLIALGRVCNNDLRTIFLVHDKRMLALLSNTEELVQNGILGKEDAEYLASRINSTFLASDFPGGDKTQWLLKPTTLGKGQGIVFGKDMTQQEWDHAIAEAKVSNKFVVQQICEQPRFPLETVPIPEAPVAARVEWSVVGTFFSVNGQFLGPCVWRSSPSDIVAVSRGGMMMFGYTSVAPTDEEELDDMPQEELEKEIITLSRLAAAAPSKDKHTLRRLALAQAHKMRSLGRPGAAPDKNVGEKFNAGPMTILTDMTNVEDLQPGLMSAGLSVHGSPKYLTPISPMTPNTFSAQLPTLPIPNGCDFVVEKTPVNSVDDLLHGAMADKYYQDLATKILTCLETVGYCVARVGFVEEAGQEGKAMEYLSRLFADINSHSSKTDALWDIRPKTTLSRRATLKRNMHVARSHTMDEFEWHTDCSFEAVPPRYMGLQVIHEDRCGGGFFRIMALDDLCDFIGEENMKVLESDEFEIVVPPEFRKDDGKVSVIGAVITPAVFDGTRHYSPRHHRCLRFRADITRGLTPRAEAALAKLCEGIKTADERNCLWRLGQSEMQPGTILFCDNARYLHSRTAIKDPQRWLKRIRMHPKKTDWKPVFSTK